MQNNKCKMLWDLWITSLLMFITLVVPVRLAFSDQDSVGWIAVYSCVDFCFLNDIILTFFSSYSDSITNDEVTDLRKISVNYIKGWFFFDVASIIPLDYLIEGD